MGDVGRRLNEYESLTADTSKRPVPRLSSAFVG